jgi:hypothetical protein
MHAGCRVSCVVLATLFSALLVPTYFSSIRQSSMVGWNRVWCEVLWLGLRESTESASGIIEMTAARLPNPTVTLVSPGSPRVTPAGHLINFRHATGPELRTAAHSDTTTKHKTALLIGRAYTLTSRHHVVISSFQQQLQAPG